MRRRCLIDTHDDFPTEQAGKDRPRRGRRSTSASRRRWRTPIWRGSKRRRGRGVLRGLRRRRTYGLGPRAYERGLEVIGRIHHTRRSLSQRFRSSDHRRADRGRAQAGQDRGADRHRRRPRHRGQSGQAARVLQARCPLHDVDAHQHQQLGGFLRRHQRRLR